MKAQGYFGGTKPKSKAVKVRQVGASSAQAPNQLTNNAGQFPGMNKGRKQFAIPKAPLVPKVTVKQVGTFNGTGQTNNSKQYRDPSTRTKTKVGKPLGYGPQVNQDL
jgi:hypothetical protein